MTLCVKSGLELGLGLGLGLGLDVLRVGYLMCDEEGVMCGLRCVLK